MLKVLPMRLDQAPPAEAVALICARFSWARPHRAFLQRCVEWQMAASPRPNFYFRWHLPRLLATLEVAAQALGENPASEVLDLATFPPFSVLMEEFCRSQGWNPAWVRTSLDGATARFDVAGKEVAIPTETVDLNGKGLPFADERFDCVLFTETIEHLPMHPQPVLLEINRILKVGGRLVLTTPNVTSWKKLFLISNGDWSYDSPTFSGEWGHRYEYSFYQVDQLLKASGFEPVHKGNRDIYFDDPHGPAQAVQFWALVAAKLALFQVRQAGKLLRRNGSGLLFLYRKAKGRDELAPEKLVAI